MRKDARSEESRSNISAVSFPLNCFLHVWYRKETEANEMLQSLKADSGSAKMSWGVDLVEIVVKANDPQYSPEQDLKVRHHRKSQSAPCLDYTS